MLVFIMSKCTLGICDPLTPFMHYLLIVDSLLDALIPC
jgi:hypothetical protein